MSMFTSLVLGPLGQQALTVEPGPEDPIAGTPDTANLIFTYHFPLGDKADWTPDSVNYFEMDATGAYSDAPLVGIPLVITYNGGTLTNIGTHTTIVGKFIPTTNTGVGRAVVDRTSGNPQQEAYYTGTGSGTGFYRPDFGAGADKYVGASSGPPTSGDAVYVAHRRTNATNPVGLKMYVVSDGEATIATDSDTSTRGITTSSYEVKVILPGMSSGAKFYCEHISVHASALSDAEVEDYFDALGWTP